MGERAIRAGRMLVVLAAASCVASCATPGPAPVLLPVGTYRQSGDDQCGPAALAAVYRFWGVDESESDVAARIHNPEAGGTLALMLVADARRQGFQAAFSETDSAALLDAVRSGVPPVCLVASSRGKHFVVVTGFRRRAGAIDWRVADGRGRPRWVKPGPWEKQWSRGGNFAVFISPAGHAFVPAAGRVAEVPDHRYSAAEHNDFGVVYEAAGDVHRAEREFRRAIDEDATLAVAWTNLGNVLNATDRWEEARAAYRRALDLEPGNGPAANNLALTYQDQPERGLAILDQYQPLVDPAFLPAFESTRETLSRALPPGK